MSPIPSIQVPDVPITSSRSTHNSPATPKTPRSMLKNLFNWKKPSLTRDNDVMLPLNASVDERPQTACSKQGSRSRKPSFSQRSRSENVVPQQSKTRSKSRRRSRSRSRAIWDPPPLFQAYNQAFMYDTLQIPNKGFLDWLPRNSPARLSARTFDSADEDQVEVTSPALSHRRSMSDPNGSSLSKKLFFLIENGHILQYKAEGSQDRLPERVLELSRDSVAFASDAIAGQHWVLEVCPYGRTDEEVKNGSSKSPWSRMALRAQDTKKLSEKLLLVFDSPDTLFTWLIAIRKQIEGLGGIEYQPDTNPLPQLEPKRPNLRHASSEYFKKKNGALLFSRSSTALPLRVDDPSEHENELPQIPANLSYKQSVSVRSTAASSVTTNTSSDRYRESYSGSSTAGTALSSDFSAVSLSPTKDVFPPMLSPTLPREGLNLRLSPTREAFPPMLSPTLPREALSWRNIDTAIPKTPKFPSVNREERSASPDILTMMECIDDPSSSREQLDDSYVEPAGDEDLDAKSVPQVVVAEDTAFSSEIHSPTIVTLSPVSELRRKLRQAQRNLSANNVDSNVNSDTNEAPSVVGRHAHKPSLSTSKGNYGLFPKKLALDVKTEPLVVAEQNNVPGLPRNYATDHLEISQSPITPVAATFGDHLFARSNVSFKRPAPIALPGLLAPREIEQPMRSPAVTDLMLDTNFGMGPSGSATQPASPVEIRVPSFSDLKVDRTLLDSLREIDTKTNSPALSPNRQSLTPRRSMPNFHYGLANAPSAPVGPPPMGPLPAVPPVSDCRISCSSALSKRTSTQSSGNRRASTKSVASTKKIRSPTPSFSQPSSQRHRSSSVKSPILNDVQNSSPITPSMVLNKLEHPAITIGQVSIISAPPPPPLPTIMPKHKKSLSVSSIKSSQSKKTHNRSSSSRSIHTSISNIPLISHLIAPPCGHRLDTEFSNKSHLGVSGARSST